MIMMPRINRVKEMEEQKTNNMTKEKFVFSRVVLVSRNPEIIRMAMIEKEVG